MKPTSSLLRAAARLFTLEAGTASNDSNARQLRATAAELEARRAKNQWSRRDSDPGHQVAGEASSSSTPRSTPASVQRLAELGAVVLQEQPPLGTIAGFGDDLFGTIASVVDKVPLFGPIVATAANAIKHGVDSATGHDPDGADHAAQAAAAARQQRIDADYIAIQKRANAAEKRAVAAEKKALASAQKQASEHRKFQSLERVEHREKMFLWAAVATAAASVAGVVVLLVKGHHHR